MALGSASAHRTGNHDRKLLGRLRKHLDNPDELIRPELVAAVVDEAATDDAIFTSDTGMSGRSSRSAVMAG